MVEPVVIILAIVVAVLAALTVFSRSPISSAFSLVIMMVGLAGIYGVSGAHFIAALQAIVYAGAIMVLFVFVIMLLNAGSEKKAIFKPWGKYFGAPLLLIFFGLMSFVVQRFSPSSDPVVFGNFTAGGPREIGTALFTTYLLPFEITSVLILIAILGAIVLARKEID